jgi:preprotein translocase SecE subunit
MSINGNVKGVTVAEKSEKSKKSSKSKNNAANGAAQSDVVEASNRPSGKRRLRAGTESIREKTANFNAASEKRPSVIAAFFYGFFAPVRFIGRLIAKLGRFRLFRWIGYVLLPPYFRNSWRELRKVEWPNRKQSVQLTGAVIIFAVIFGGIVAGVDFGLDKAFKEILLKK